MYGVSVHEMTKIAPVCGGDFALFTPTRLLSWHVVLVLSLETWHPIQVFHKGKQQF
jgi:hypothetical protein